MDGIHSVHKREWEKSSLPTLQYNKQISKNPKILEQLQDGTGPKQLQQHTVDTLTNVTALQHTLDSLKTKLTNMIERGNYDPPDVLHDPTPPQKTRRWSSISVLVGVVVSGVVVWRTLVLWRYGNILHGITGNRTLSDVSDKPLGLHRLSDVSDKPLGLHRLSDVSDKPLGLHRLVMSLISLSGCTG
ncbi:hypothetical protein DPMN_016600 [Dreissena polymorpha]|uniref:Uncharacterized protein n=1 Tax=Dreissena polymorpha TaxID=45954 RepID=A0A9D4NFY3_DREPO|nr:hypothetical protein DPMN_016600 [Dreissena polymorpha]